MKTSTNISNSEIARELGVSKEAVRKWFASHQIPAERVICVSRLHGWSPSPHDLRPDLYPNPTDALPSNLPERVA